MLEGTLKIHITGNAGAGKTSLALALGHQLALPVYHLDSAVWQPGWKKTPEPERRRLELAMMAGDHWIIEGVSARARSAADVIIFLDYPRWRCLARALRRSAPYWLSTRSRPELPPRCPELFVLPRLLRIIFAFPDLVRPVLLEEASASGKYRLVRTDEELAAAIASVRKPRERLR